MNMNKFWDWYNEKYMQELSFLRDGYVEDEKISHGLIVGRMIDYLIEKKEYDNFIDDMYLKHLYDVLGIDALYKDLKQKIKGLK